MRVDNVADDQLPLPPAVKPERQAALGYRTNGAAVTAMTYRPPRRATSARTAHPAPMEERMRSHYAVLRWWWPFWPTCSCGRWRPCRRPSPDRVHERILDDDRVPWVN